MSKRLALFILIFLLSTNFTLVYAQTPPPPDGPIYIVQEGDSLWTIALRFNIDVDELMIANGLTGGDIYPGDRLVIPGMEGIIGTLTSRRVEYGENLRTLARQYQWDLNLLKKLNHLTSPTEFYAGANLIMLLQEDLASLSTRISLTEGETLLELAVRQDADPWTIVEINDLSGSWAGLPADVLYLTEGTSTTTLLGLPAIFGNVEVTPLPIIQGTTAEIRIAPAGEAVFGGNLINQSLHFFQMEDGQTISLQGVHALTQPGMYPLRIEATLPDGTEYSFEQNILIISGGYPQDPILYVDDTTIDPETTEPETQRILEIVEPCTLEKFWTGIFTTPASAYADSTYFTSRFGNRRTYVGIETGTEIYGFHTGLDFGGGTGLPITAPAGGKVVFAEEITVRGNATIIDHGWGVYSGFWHQSEILVQVGDMVQQGQIIGLVGGTGRVTGAHLHWEVWANGVQVDPMQWLTEQFPH